MGTSFGDRLKSLGEDYGFRLLLTSGAVILSALVQCFALQALVRPAGIISGGFTGIAMLMEALGSRWGIPVSMQAVMLILNVPVALFCGRGISLRLPVWPSFCRPDFECDFRRSPDGGFRCHCPQGERFHRRH